MVDSKALESSLGRTIKVMNSVRLFGLFVFIIGFSIFLLSVMIRISPDIVHFSGRDGGNKYASIIGDLGVIRVDISKMGGSTIGDSQDLLSKISKIEGKLEKYRNEKMAVKDDILFIVVALVGAILAVIGLLSQVYLILSVKRDMEFQVDRLNTEIQRRRVRLK